INESFFAVKGAALFPPRGNSPTPNSAPCISLRRNKHTGDLQKHLQTMFTVLRPEDTIKLAVLLESSSPQVTRYMVVISTNGRQDTEESIVLGMDFMASDSSCTVGLVLPLWSDTMIHLDGDGGFSVSTVSRVHVFKPVSVQAMWSALQSLHKACDVARCYNYYPGSPFLTWVSYYQSMISSNQFCINEWNAMQDVESHRANSPVLFTDLPTERERTERLITMRLREIMMQKDLDNVTCKEIRTELETQMVCNLREYKEFIDNEMIVILGQMDSPTEIFEHVYLGSEWNASNLEELQNSGVRYILNVTREIDNFFPGMFEYHNIRVYDEETTNLLEYWNETYKFISKARKAGAKCLVHCKMGVSRSASTVIAYAMKEYGWDLDTAFEYVKEKRAVTKPNPSFMKQLEEYQGILLASKQRHNKLWRSHSDSDLSDPPDSKCKPSPRPLGRSNSNNNSSSPSLHNFLGVAVLQALSAEPEDFDKSHTTYTSDSLTDSNDVCESLCQDDHRSDCGSPLLFPVTNLQAVTVPDENLNDSTSVTVPVALPHPPPSLHILPPTPELQCSHWGRPTELSISVPQHKTVELCLDMTEQSGSDEVSPLTVESTDSDILDQSLLNAMSNKHRTLSPATLSPLSLPPLAPKDNNNNPSKSQTGSELGSDYNADRLPKHIEDSIDFVSAREKFQCLTQPLRSRTLSEDMQQRIPQSPEEHGVTEAGEQKRGNGTDQVFEQSENSPDPSHQPHHNNGVSVHHIVTEIEAICHPAFCTAPPSSCSSSLPTSSHNPLLHTDNETEAETSEIKYNSLTSPLGPQSPFMLPCDWPAGLVRRATKQLEQKLQHKKEMAASPLHSPSTEHTPDRLSLCSLSAEHSRGKIIPQGENTAESAKYKDRGRLTWPHTDFQRLYFSDTDILQYSSNSPISNISQCGALPNFDGNMLTSSVASLSQSKEITKDTSAQCEGQSQLHSQNLLSPPQPQACSYPETVDVVTVSQLDTDEMLESCSRLACSSKPRLRELQASLHDGISLETTDSQEGKVGQSQGLRNVMDTCRRMSFEQTPTVLHVGQCLREQQDDKSFLEQTRWHKAVELEARIRQAGLTTPSFMKRSASLAKLDCLELSASDLSDLDLRPHTRTTPPHSQDSSPATPDHPDDTWKKQKVLAQNNCVEKTCSSHRGRDLDESSFSPSFCLPCTTHHSKDDTTKSEEQDGTGSGSVTTSRQQGRGHASRRSRKASAEKKQRATAVLYNTM
ncbi:protein phosphatase Slingshot homolog 2-like, partial [Notolabrus celidotus]|uniref:protein phosphatase Slingshot homolog 2-like n=1 Tax=Notolabrus celidotus TaxID=1203425 RepID=UPI0014903ED9